MGIISKIEDKLSGNKHHGESQPSYSANDRTSLDKQGEYQNPSATSTSGYGTSHHSGSSAPGQAYGGSSSGGQVANDLRHPIQAATGRGNDGYGTQYGSDKTHAVEPVDPYTTKGQNAMAAASSGGHGHGHHGHPNTSGYAGEQDVDRSRLGGITNSGNGSGLRSGHHSSLEDHDAIPVAGGRKVGDVGSETSHGQHHYGRDAAIAGGAGALGAEAYSRHERDRDGREGHHHGTHHREAQVPTSGYGQDPYQSSGVSSAQQYGGATSGQGAYDQPSVGREQLGNTSGHHVGGASGVSALPTEKKLGGAYEAGYRDAMAHIEAERQKR